MNTSNTVKNKAHQYFEVADGVWGMKAIFVNFYMIANPIDSTWVLVDTGIKTSAPKIKKMATDIFGEGARPSCIILTHAHFDHIGSLKKLAEYWDVPVYSHFLELPYLTGKSSYPPPDPTVGGGIMPLLSVIFPRDPIDLGGRVKVLDSDGSLPCLPQWKYFHTPGHAPGHISLYRESDKVLIAGDAFITTNQQSAISIMLQTKILLGPPKYFTYDWQQSKDSVRKLMNLEPEIAATGHGKPMRGEELRKDLHYLYNNFTAASIPEDGRYTNDPAVADASGFIYVPAPNYNKKKILLGLLGLTAIAAATYLIVNKKQKKYL